MSTSVTGRLVDDNQAPLANLRVLVRDESALFSSDLNSALSGNDGRFTVAIGADLTPELGTRQLGIQVLTQARRQLYKSAHADGTSATLDLGDVSIRKVDATGWTVTLLGSPHALPVREGNTVRPLVDNEDAWGHVKDAMIASTTSITVMELSFDVPGHYDADPNLEVPEIVLSFGSAVDPVTPRTVMNADDYRPERLLLTAAHTRTVRIMIPDRTTNWAIVAIDVLILLIPALLAVLCDIGKVWGVIWAQLFGNAPSGGASAVAGYFGTSGGHTKVTTFHTGMFNVVHAKMVMVDDAEAIVLGSPLSQSYWDTHAHHVFEPRRGSAAGEPIPVHDVSLAVRGPAVKDIHDAFILHWNRDCAVPDKVNPISAAAPITSAGSGESLAALQLVRTINAGAFDDIKDGEQGVLEAYQRAIENAQVYIYLENQYFTNETIAQALVAALNDTARPNLQVILMLNVTPDMPFYPVWQGGLVERIRRDAKTNASRFGVFTAWTHDPPMPSRQQAKPMLMPNYLHSKVGIVDGTWATVGSANLDGASLDYFQILRALQFRDNRNHELNYTLFNGIDGHPATDAVDQLRIALWSEHLGIDASDARLAGTTQNNADWLTLWNAQAKAKQDALVADPANIVTTNGRALAYPVNAQSGFSLMLGWADPHRDYLKKCGVDLSKVDLIEQTTAFSFHDGTWS